VAAAQEDVGVVDAPGTIARKQVGAIGIGDDGGRGIETADRGERTLVDAFDFDPESIADEMAVPSSIRQGGLLPVQVWPSMTTSGRLSRGRWLV
jgi:hypothetical protein